MSHNATQTPQSEMIPKPALWAMLGLVLAVLALVSVAKFSGMQPAAQPVDAPVVASVTIFIDAEMSGAARVLDATGSVIADLSPEQGGFVAGVGRVLDRERAKHGVALTGPVIVNWRENRRISISDPTTGWGADLMGFGADNARAFARLVASGTKGIENGIIDTRD